MRNAIHDVNYGILQQLHEQLNAMRACAGAKDCNKAGLWYRDEENKSNDEMNEDDT